MSRLAAAVNPERREFDLRTRAGVWFGVLTCVYTASVLLPLPGADGRIVHLPSVCPFYTLTGLPCPGCGLTRAFVCLGHGRISDSLHWHGLGIALYALGIVVWACAGMSWLRNAPVIQISPTVSSRLSRGMLGVMVVFGAMRVALILTKHWTF